MIAVTLGAGLLLGLLLGGNLRRLAQIDIRRPWLAGLAVVAQLLAPLTALTPLVLLVVSQLLLLAFLIDNRHLPGMVVIAAGIASNALVINLNGGMPVSRDAILFLDASPFPDDAFTDGKHQLLTDGDQLTFLADVIPVPVLDQVLSVGDLFIIAGGIWLIAAAMHREPAAQAPPEAA